MAPTSATTKIRGLNALLVTTATDQTAPVIIGQQLRRGGTHSVRGADKLLSDSLATLTRMPNHNAPVVVRADSAAYYSSKVAKAVLANDADLSVTVPLYPSIKHAIGVIDNHAWTSITYPQAIWDEESQQMISAAEVAETDFTAFSSKPDATTHVPGRLVVRCVPDRNPKKLATAQGRLFDTYRYHAFSPPLRSWAATLLGHAL